jgi:hypothetical protein
MNEDLKKLIYPLPNIQIEAFAHLTVKMPDLTHLVMPKLTLFLENWASIIEGLMPYLAALSKFDWPAITQRLDKLPERSREAMRLALAEGWFFGWHEDLQTLIELVEGLNAAEPGLIEDVMATYYRTNLQHFSRRLVKEYPQRAEAIKAAVHAHNLIENGYILSVPVFIAQADGLLSEITGIASPLQRENIKQFTNQYAADQEILDLLSPFLNLKASNFLMQAKARDELVGQSGKSFTALNRHQVMHGERSDYGTEINSLKAFSFLVFVGLHVPAVTTNKVAGRESDTENAPSV